MAQIVKYNRRSSVAPRTHCDPVVDGSQLAEIQFSNPRKRQRTEQHLSSSPTYERQKKPWYQSHGYINTPAFWNSLSKIWLTKYALRELDRRNNCASSPGRQVPRPTTRNFLAEQRNLRRRISAGDFFRNSIPEHSKDIKRFARDGGPDLSDLISYYTKHIPLNCNIGSSTLRTGTTERTTTRKSPMGESKMNQITKPRDANYEQILIDGGIFPNCYEFPLPSNWEEINRRLAQPRPSLSTFSDDKYREFVRENASAFNEDEVKDSELSAMLGAIDASMGAKKNILFTNIEPIIPHIARAKPDYYRGAQTQQIHLHVRNELGKYLIPSKHTHLPAVPNFFLEVKGPDGTAAVVKRQACHDGAVGARAMQSLRSYGQDEPVCDNNAYTISFTYCDGTLKMYGHSTAQPKGPGTKPEYYMYQLDAWCMSGNKFQFLQGATAFKNAIDLTEEYRNAAITLANETAARILVFKDEDGEVMGSTL